jgi:polyferredoxin
MKAVAVESKARLNDIIKKRRRNQMLLWWLLPLVMIGGWFYPLLGMVALACIILAMAISIYRGRYWCGNLCPRGSFWDLILSKISARRKVPKFFRSSPHKLLWVGIIMTVMTLGITNAGGDIEKIGLVFVTLITVTTVVGVLFGVPTHERNWCYYCPIGSFQSILGRGKYPLKISSDCNSCKRCSKVCPMQLEPWKYKPENGWAIVEELDCIKCGLCVAACPKSALKLGD